MNTRPDCYYSKVDSRGRIWVRKAMREHMGLPSGGQIVMKINDEGHLVLRAMHESKSHD
jgi:bifunctional DNA-binding transcriptional regulator/antitoxin component of YhaV-PrlF toxin-antitoxin module